MNIKFILNKIKDNEYEFNIIHIDDNFLKKIRIPHVIHIDFRNKKIRCSDSWDDCRISNDKFSFYIYNGSYSISKVEHGFNNKEDAYLLISNILNTKQVIKTDIRDFDKILIKGLKALSDAYNNKDYVKY